VADGLAYLHSQKVVHGDINDVSISCGSVGILPPRRTHILTTQTNILIDGEGRVQISDFGLAIVGTNTDGSMSASTNAAGTIGFMSPERFTSDARKRTWSDDTYTFASLCYYVGVFF
jgi:serine/threonine protein kinase